MAENSSQTGLGKTTAAALSYVLGPITGVIFLILEKDPYVRFHAMQSIIIFSTLFLIQWILGFTIVLLPITPFISLLAFILWLFLIYKAWQGDQWEVPFVGKYAKKMVERV